MDAGTIVAIVGIAVTVALAALGGSGTLAWFMLTQMHDLRSRVAVLENEAEEIDLIRQRIHDQSTELAVLFAVTGSEPPTHPKRPPRRVRQREPEG